MDAFTKEEPWRVLEKFERDFFEVEQERIFDFDKEELQLLKDDQIGKQLPTWWKLSVQIDD